MQSVLQDWVMELNLREQGTILTALRGCDLAPKEWDEKGEVKDTQIRRLTAWLRNTCMNAADEREIDHPGGFMQSKLPQPFKPSGIMHYPAHWVLHLMHAFEIVGYLHPEQKIAIDALSIYVSIVSSMHLHYESKMEMQERLSEDRIKSGTVVS